MKKNVNLSVSVIVPEFNAEEEDIKDLLTSLLASDYPANLFEIIIVDDGSEKNHILETLLLKGLNGRRLAEAELDTNLICKKYLQFLNRVLKKRVTNK
jgi:cellulose synthase/poly-beta-1,6-N-acetylglucosamine synthase-like glycosyltransferase